MVAIRSVEHVLVDPDAIRRAYAQGLSMALDLETTGFSPFRDRVVVVSLAAPDRPPAVLRCVNGKVPEWVLELVGRPGATIIGHNLAAFDLPFLVRAGACLNPKTRYVDTLVLEQLCLVSGRRDLRKDLATTLHRRLGVTVNKTVDHTGWEASELTEAQVLYCANDVAHLHALVDQQLEQVQSYGLQDALALETGLVPVTAAMVALGLPFRVGAMRDLVQQHRAQAQAAAERLAALGLQNPRSTPQVRAVFRDRFGLSLKSTNADTLTTVVARGGPAGEAAHLILQARSDLKQTMYDDDWLEKYVDADSRVRARYWQLGTDTGRYSSSDPNLQQIPKGLRPMIGYEDGNSRALVAVDYRQLEVVIASVVLRDQALQRAVQSEDVHSYTASLMFRVPVDQITPEQRRVAKAATFTVLFAGGAQGVQRAARQLELELSTDDAMAAIAQFYAAYPTVQQMVSILRAQVRQKQLTGTSYRVSIPGGPVRYLQGDRLSASTVINTLVQGSAAVGLKRAMRRLWERFGPIIAASVHDELVFDVPTEQAADVAEVARGIMEAEMQNVVGLPVGTSVHVGPQWK